LHIPLLICHAFARRFLNRTVEETVRLTLAGSLLPGRTGEDDQLPGSEPLTDYQIVSWRSIIPLV
jgi:hypothetical protein